MPAQPVSVNLLDQPEFEASSVAHLLNWAISYGRYIMIGTEIIVLLAFISRFSLDRKLTDLREEIAQKQIILEANQDFEKEFKHLQVSIERVKGLLAGQETPIATFYQIGSILPPDVRITSYKLNKENLDITVLAGTTEGFSLFLGRLQQISNVKNIDVTEIIKDPLEGTSISLKATVK